jgi:hypothetical protein
MLRFASGEELSALEGIESNDWPRILQVVLEVCSPGERPPLSGGQRGKKEDGSEIEAEGLLTRLGAVKQLLESKGFTVIVESQDLGLSPPEEVVDYHAFLHFTPKEAGLFYVYARRIQ